MFHERIWPYAITNKSDREKNRVDFENLDK